MEFFFIVPHIFDRVERSAAPHLQLRPRRNHLTTSQVDNKTLLAYLPTSYDIPLLAPNPLESTGAFPRFYLNSRLSCHKLPHRTNHGR